MKTLDEVIVALEVCTSGYCSHPKHGDCPYLDERYDCDTRQRKLDALHYLREYRDKHDEMLKMEEALGYCEMADNRPLTWSELQQMEGKPVWLESHGDISEFTGWVIVRNVLEDRSYFILSHYDGDFLTYEMALPDCTFGTKWQAYRKERE